MGLGDADSGAAEEVEKRVAPAHDDPCGVGIGCVRRVGGHVARRSKGRGIDRSVEPSGARPGRHGTARSLEGGCRGSWRRGHPVGPMGDRELERRCGVDHRRVDAQHGRLPRGRGDRGFGLPGRSKGFEEGTAVMTPKAPSTDRLMASAAPDRHVLILGKANPCCAFGAAIRECRPDRRLPKSAGRRRRACTPP